ncbi:MAG: outer membrane lipoprotein carrier protein LolA [Saprospiraceae bacterium]|nr:outer membrane lipoprotein carrier protein LolA [Saprospiraceae bacterium]
MLKSIYILLFTGMTFVGFSQTMTSVADNDPAAKKILDKLKAEYDTYTSMEVDFELVLELPQQETEVQNGKVIQQGDNYKLDLDDRAIYSNGSYVWLHVKRNNEVQINDADMDEDDTNMMSPKDMLQLYESGEYLYAITAEPLLDGKKVTQIEFKPLDRDSEFSKMALYVDKKTKKMAQMKVFSKDGGRYTLKISDITPNKKYPLSIFAFDASKFPGIHIEDLRID